MTAELTVGEWLKRRRRQLDLTQKELAYRVGSSVGTIRKIEADERRPSRQLAGLLAEALAIPPDKFETFIAFSRVESFSAEELLSIIPPQEEAPRLPAALPTVQSIPTVKNNLPPAGSEFIGRESELVALQELFDAPQTRLVTIVGPGGMGKTRLALAFADLQRQIQSDPARQSAAGPEYIYFLELASLNDVESIGTSLVEATGIQSQAEKSSDVRQHLLDYFREKRALIVFDNFEHLLSGTGWVTDMLQAGPGVRILATSRVRLQLHDEQVFPVLGLAVPEEGRVEDAALFPAVRLFLQAARRVQPHFKLPDDLRPLIQISRLVDGMPLALELAAGWVDMLSPEEIASEIRQSLDFLESEARDLPARQRSIRASFDYSWQRLDEKERDIFAQISIFRGGFTRPAVEFVAGANLRQLSRLTSKSFIRFDPETNRYHVHELMRQYAAEKLAGDEGHLRAVRARFAAYFSRFVAGFSADLKGAGQRDALVHIHADLENVQQGWAFALASQDLDALGRASEPLFRFYWNRASHMPRGARDFEQAVAAVRAGQQSRERGLVLGRLLASLGWCYVMLGETDAAHQAATDSLKYLIGEDSKEQVLALLCLGETEPSMERSTRLLQDALVLAREVGDHWAVGDALLRLGVRAQQANEFQQAMDYWQQAREQFQKNGDISGVTWTVGFLSVLAEKRGRYEEALAFAQDSMQNLDHSDSQKVIYYTMGRAFYNLGRYEQARLEFEKRHRLIRDEGQEREDPDNSLFLGKIAFKLGDYPEAERILNSGLEIAKKYHQSDDISRLQDALSRLYLAWSKMDQSRDHILSALRTAKIISLPHFQLANLVSAAELLEMQARGAPAARIAVFVAAQPATHAKVQERAMRLVERLRAAAGETGFDPEPGPQDDIEILADLAMDLLK